MKRAIWLALLSAFVSTGAVMLSRTGSAVVETSGPSPTPSPVGESFETIKEFLITSAATDFTEHQPPYPAKFRKVKIGHMGDTTKSGAWRMCGEFLPTAGGGEKPEWTGFATVKTSGYEQYIGSGSNFCTFPTNELRTSSLATFPVNSKRVRFSSSVNVRPVLYSVVARFVGFL